MPLVHFPYRWLPRTLLKNLAAIWYDITGGIGNICRWTPVIWHDRDWDWRFLARAMEYKLTRMAKLFQEHGNHVDSERDAQRMRMCVQLLHRLQADEYVENAQREFGEEGRAAYDAALRNQKNDQRYLGLILGKYLNHWWD